MPNNIAVIAEYREQKQKTEALAVAARKQMQAQYRDLLSEAAGLQKDFKDHFGATPELPDGVEAFTLGAAAPAVKRAQTASAAVGKKIGGLRRSLSAAIKHGEQGRIAEVVSQLAAMGVDIPDLPSTTVPSPMVGDDFTAF